MTADQPNAFPRAARQSWLEINVRPWLAVTALMLLAAIGTAIYSVVTAQEERRIIASGTRADAVVVGLGRDTRQLSREEPVSVVLQYTNPQNGRLVTSERMIHRKPGALIRLKEVIPIKFDPGSPATWTARSDPLPFLQPLTVPLALIPVVIASLAVTWWQRARVLRVLETGTRQPATVTSVKQSPLAPMSKLVGVSRESDRMVRHLFWPTWLGPIAKGEVIDVVSHGKIVLAAKAYE